MLPVITNGFNSPDGTYFRTSAAEPELEETDLGQHVLKLVNGEGSRRSSWGAPGVTSTVLLNTSEMCAVHVGFHHKHGGGQFYRYYRHEGGEVWQQVTWQKLNDDERAQVIDAYDRLAPEWAKSPGKLRVDRVTPETQVRTTLKIVAVIDGKYYSVFDGKTEYILGKRLAQRALDGHGGGYYSYPELDAMLERFNNRTLFPRRCYAETMELAILECEVSGRMVDYAGKIASTYIKPVRELSRFSYTPAMQEAC